MSDIRSFFSPSPSTRKRKASDDAINSAVKKTKEEERLELDEQSATTKEVKADDHDTSTEATTTSATDASEEAAVVHSYANLAVNAKKLLHASWFEELQAEFKASYFTRLVQFLGKEDRAGRTIYPPPQQVFSALQDCAFSSLKVVIIGQDPYHGPKQAHGLCFSVQHGIPPPPSLKNIFKEAQNDVKIHVPSHGCLTSWSQQGVLLLNTVMTVRKSEPNSHKNQGWERFTDAVIDHVNRHSENLVFLLWGKPAQVKGARIDKSKHLVVASSHPSPLGATKTNAPFIGSKCFSHANKYLVDHGKTPIDWNLD